MHNYNSSSTQHWFPCIAANWRARQHWKARRERWEWQKNFHIQLLENIRINKENQKHFYDSILSELLTRLKDAIFADNWEIQVFQVTRLKYRFYCYCIIVCFKRRRTTEWLKTLIFFLKLRNKNSVTTLMGIGTTITFSYSSSGQFLNMEGSRITLSSLPKEA